MRGAPNKGALITELLEEWCGCKKCPQMRKSGKALGNGNINTGLMIIGIAPGEQEEDEGLPFVGPSGEKLTEHLTQAGIKREDVYMTNLVLCRPKKKDLYNRIINRDPSRIEVQNCMERLWQEIYLVDPIAILLLGKPVINIMTKKAGEISKWRGKVLSVPIKGKERVLNYPAIGTYHPSFLLRRVSIREGDPEFLFEKDLNRTIKFVKELTKVYKDLEASHA